MSELTIEKELIVRQQQQFIQFLEDKTEGIIIISENSEKEET